MGLYPQPNEWTCGPFALKHALATLGRIADEAEIRRHAQTDWWSGTDEIRLAKAARVFGCDLPTVRSLSPQRAKRLLVEHLRQKVPVIMCVDEWSHWITVVRHEASQFVILDSNLDPVLQVVSWSTLNKRWRYFDHDYHDEEPPAQYDMHPVEPWFRVSVKADFSIKRVKHLRRKENRDLARYWAVYLEDLLEICRPPTVQMVKPLSMAEFLRRNQDLIISRVCYWHGDVDPKQILRLLQNFRFVAETYGLVIPSAKARRAAVDFAVLVTLWTVSARGIGDMYGTQNGSPT